MTFNQKRKRNRAAGLKYCFIPYTTDEIKQIYYDECKSLDDALDKYEKNISKYCRQNGFYKRDYFIAMYEDVLRRIIELWIQEN